MYIEKIQFVVCNIVQMCPILSGIKNLAFRVRFFRPNCLADKNGGVPFGTAWTFFGLQFHEDDSVSTEFCI